MQRLSITDAMFISFETANTPMHVGNLTILEPDDPGDEQGCFANKLYQRLCRSTEVETPFNSIPRRSLAGFLYWETVAVDLTAHLIRHALPFPGTQTQLEQLTACLHTPMMDLTRPPWELHLIEGLEGGRIALYTKIHHCMADGASFTELMARFLCQSDDAAVWRPFWQLPVSRPSANRWQRLSEGVSKTARLATHWPDFGKLGLQLLLSRLTPKQSRLTSPFSAPGSLLNQKPMPRKGFATATLKLSQLKQLGHLTGTTVNDVAMTVCDLALSRYLAEQQCPQNKPLVAMVPVKLPIKTAKANDDLAGALIEMGQQNATACERLAQITAASTYLKHQAIEPSPEAYQALSLFIGVSELLGNSLNLGKLLNPSCNLVLSNVAGPRTPLSLPGARVEASYPLSALMPGSALNITLFSYLDQLNIGLTYCPVALPDFDQLPGYLTEALHTLEKDVLSCAISAAAAAG